MDRNGNMRIITLSVNGLSIQIRSQSFQTGCKKIKSKHMLLITETFLY